MADPIAAPAGVSPLLAINTARRTLTAETAARLARDVYGVDGEIEWLSGERSENFLVRTPDRALVLRLSGAEEDIEGVGLQIALLEHIAAQDPGLPIPRVVRTLSGQTSARLQGGLAGSLLYAQTVVPGRRFDQAPPTEALLEDLGRVLARLDRALRGFYHPWAPRRLAWDLRNAPVLRQDTHLIGDPDLRRLVEFAFDQFIAHSLPRFGGLRSQFIHNDLHPGNLFVATDAPDTISGLIDFGDVVHAPLICELAVSCADQMGEAEPFDAAAPILRGYTSLIPLETEELAPLYDAILTRCAATLAVAASRKTLGAEATPIRPDVEKQYQRALERLVEVGRTEGIARLSRHAQRVGGAASRGHDAPDMDSLITRRHRVLGSNLALSYRHPLHIVGGHDVWLTAADGRRYLDAYNNVPHVGHAHPDVVEAIARQSARLNTNTRYLHETVLDYSERLLAKMPPELDVCVFMNSGSEANDVAWQMAQAWSGARGALVMENAYHGITDALVPLSPYEIAPGEVAAHVRTLTGDKAAEADRFAEAADRAIASLAKAGLKPAALMVDTAFTSGGILDVVPGYLSLLAAKVLAAGGLFIADEVQYGFGRPGAHFWGFGLHGAVPDIVTLGKPIGNGYPIGAVVTRREILDAFTRRTDYFSTFGGNPVAAAAALAVLDVIEREGLQANAAETGAYLKGGLERLKEAHGGVGDVRGAGLLLGVYLVTDRASRDPDRDLADRVKNRMRHLGVLVGTTGTHGNVLKIRPPMSFQRRHADELVKVLDHALADEGR